MLLFTSLVYWCVIVCPRLLYPVFVLMLSSCGRWCGACWFEDAVQVCRTQSEWGSITLWGVLLDWPSTAAHPDARPPLICFFTMGAALTWICISNISTQSSEPSLEIYLVVEVENEYFTVGLSDQLPTSCCCILWLVGEKCW